MFISEFTLPRLVVLYPSKLCEHLQVTTAVVARDMFIISCCTYSEHPNIIIFKKRTNKLNLINHLCIGKINTFQLPHFVCMLNLGTPDEDNQ